MIVGLLTICLVQNPLPNLHPALFAARHIRPPIVARGRLRSCSRFGNLNLRSQLGDDEDASRIDSNSQEDDLNLFHLNNANNANNVMRLLGGTDIFPKPMETGIEKDFLSPWSNVTFGLEGSERSESVVIAQIRPKMSMIFTCCACETRQMRTFSKHAYDKGIVIVTCRGCQRRHLIADNLGWHSDWRELGLNNVEQLFADRGLPPPRRIRGPDATSLYQEWEEVHVDGDTPSS